MNAEADKLQREITTAVERLAKIESHPGLTSSLHHQIDKAKGVIRDMRIKLAGRQDTRDVPCPNCGDFMPHSFFVCRPCMREVPFTLYARLKTAIGFHHHGQLPDSQLTEIKKAVLSHLKQHGTALPA